MLSQKSTDDQTSTASEMDTKPDPTMSTNADSEPKKRPATPQSTKETPRSSDQPIHADTSSSSQEDVEESKALSETMPAWAVVLVVLGILMSLFLVALDRTIVSTVCTK